VSVALENATTESDRLTHPPVSYELGRSFLESVHHVQGLPRPKLVESVAWLISGRSELLAKLDVHELRTSQAADAPPLLRRDGAKAYRAALQQRTPSARRLHYWRRPDGALELSKVGLHNDLTIA
jgi:hypothetical protein